MKAARKKGEDGTCSMDEDPFFWFNPDHSPLATLDTFDLIVFPRLCHHPMFHRGRFPTVSSVLCAS